MAEKRTETMDGLSILVHTVTQRKNSLHIFRQCHICLTRIPIIEESRDCPSIPIHCVTTERRTVWLTQMYNYNFWTQTRNRNFCVKKIAVNEMEGIQLHICVKIFRLFITPHAQRERGKVIGVGVHMFICLWTKNKFESYFSDWLTFSNLHSRTSRRIYRLALPMLAPAKLSSLSKSRISIFNAHLTLFVRRMTSHNSIGKYRYLVNWLGTGGLVSIVSKLDQFQINSHSRWATLCFLQLSVLSFDLS